MPVLNYSLDLKLKIAYIQVDPQVNSAFVVTNVRDGRETQISHSMREVDLSKGDYSEREKVWATIMAMLDHEVREHLRLNGERVFWPHSAHFGEGTCSEAPVGVCESHYADPITMLKALREADEKAKNNRVS